jgi:Collagen triple helix repeat (20 copies)
VISRIHQKLGTAGFIISIVALVAAMGGAAYAAKGALTGKQKKEVTKIAKQYAGKPGAPGAPGAVGPAGAKGDAGEKGERGEKGEPGEQGEAGNDGKSVESFPIPPGEETCNHNGGAVYEVEESGEPTEICNGAEGEPWAVGGLPKGATETGVWSLNASEATTAPETSRVLVPISFPIPLSAPIEGEENIHFVGETGDSICKGTIGKPTAPEGMLCIYAEEISNADFRRVRNFELEENVTERVGAFLAFREVEDHAASLGSFAVTGS